MTLWAFYGLVFKRAWDRSFDRARKMGFWVTIAAGVLLFIARSFHSPSRSLWTNRAVESAWMVPLAFLLLSFVWLVIRAPYELYRDKAAALEDATQTQMNAAGRAAARDWISTQLMSGQALVALLEPGRRPSIRSLKKAALWIFEAETSLEKRFDRSYRVRFAHGADSPRFDTNHDENHLLPALKVRCENLLDILKEFS